ncbi:unnamed protein product [Adineta ricciae]|uniref:Uncharacterized protein n=1 Tax=Adineta ricciae TaxID=249248 RepID=A0A816BBS4_ADIRI|nr:unnamed protein product [Adineta ricciae]CAF1607025.1 unnamed protein product [Adineta ricciae]
MKGNQSISIECDDAIVHLVGYNDEERYYVSLDTRGMHLDYQFRVSTTIIALYNHDLIYTLDNDFLWDHRTCDCDCGGN